MWKKLMLLAAAIWSAAAMAAVDVNGASAADLDSVKGIGPGTSQKILEARQQGAFKSWEDLITRVSGIGPARAAKLSEQGLRVNGTPYGTPATAPAKKAAAAPAPAIATAISPAVAPAIAPAVAPAANAGKN